MAKNTHKNAALARIAERAETLPMQTGELSRRVSAMATELHKAQENINAGRDDVARGQLAAVESLLWEVWRETSGIDWDTFFANLGQMEHATA